MECDPLENYLVFTVLYQKTRWFSLGRTAQRLVLDEHRFHTSSARPISEAVLLSLTHLRGAE
jgi:hypothetical protein